ncbi:MAG: carbon-nitrogen hydrolase [Candidatus Bathyarchaeota archaeon]|nr:carbon-nitrogen hydrolase [Candidatus Bathyarchaeota archaeon]
MVPEITAKKTGSNSRTVTVGLIQTAVSENIAENMQKTQRKIAEAAEKDAQIICLQELYRTRYFPQQENVDAAPLAEPIPGPSTDALSKLAKKHGVVIVAPLFEKAADGKYYNTAVVIDADGELLGTYRKIHIPYDPYFYEKTYFAEGNTPYQVFKTHYGRVSALICYDQWFPEAARICCLQGAEIIFYPTAIGYVKGYTSADGDWHDAWRTVQRAHAIANGVHVAAVNRVGEEGELEFWGGSFVCDSFGKVLAEASTTKEEIVIAQVDIGKNQKIQEGWGFLRNRRPDTYNLLVEKQAGGAKP